MKKYKRFRKAVKITLLVLVVLIISTGVFLKVFADLGFNDYRSLASIEKIDDFPLYVMRYYGDYGFKDCQTGQGFEGIWKYAYDKIKPQSTGPMCTCFSAENKQKDRIFGRNFDLSTTRAALLLFTNPTDGYASVSMVDITYFGFDPINTGILDYIILVGTPYLPADGMNECGVAVSTMSVSYSDGGNDPNKETLGIISLVRQILDHAGNLDEAIALANQYNVVFTYGPNIHILVSDAFGDSAVIEFLEGTPKVVRNTAKFQPCTNFILSEKSTEQALNSCWRYNKAYSTLKELQGNLEDEQAMELLKNVSQNDTIWSAIYNQSNGKIQLAMKKDYENIYEFSLDMKDKK